MSDQHSPIGILDSGIGGFSVVRQVRRLLPREELLYFGDGAHIPYGNHTRQAIVEMARYMFRFMEARGVKALLVACNTISCVLDSCGGEVSCPVFSAAQAGAEAAARLEADKVGVISTVFTHNSRVYPRSIQALSPRKLVVLSCGCPDLARLVEHSLGDPAGMAQVEENLRLELDHMVLEDRVDCCVLGCTHYPLVSDRIRRLYPGLPLIDPAEEMARSLQAYLIREGLGNPQSAPGTLSVYTTGDVEEYALRARQVGLERVSNVEYYPPMEL
jgi:glutamate racemase